MLPPTETLATVRQVLASLTPLQHLQGQLRDVTDAVQAGTALARTTLVVAEQTLRTGKQALTTATATLQTLTTSLDVQRQQLAVAQQTLEQTREINRKIPGTVAPLPGS